MALLQVLIFVTGNYCFFNLLTLALTLLLLDDGVWTLKWRGRAAGRDPLAAAPRGGRWSGWVTGPATAALFALSLVPLAGALHAGVTRLGPLPALYQVAARLRIVNGYGLFAVMTTSRPEIIVEGSNDRRSWQPYEFRYKPGDLMRRPRFVAPHQPRLDWQMWFAALSDFRRETWYLSFCQRLLEGSRPVLALLENNPFPAAPPRFVRGTVYDYHFTDAATRRATGAWWRRERRGPYSPVLTLEDGRLMGLTEAGGGRSR